MKRAVVIALVVLVNAAHADPRQVLVLRSEGTADVASRMSVDTHVLRLAKSIAGKVEAGDITLTEAAAAVGCNSSDAACKDDVLATLGVDEIVATTVTSTPSGLNVTVRRISKGSAPNAAQTTLASANAPDAKMNADIGPIFGVRLAATTLAEPATTPEPQPLPVEPTPTAQPAPPVSPADASSAPISETVTAAPTGAVAPAAVEGKAPSRRWQKIGMGVGAGMVVLGMVMWAQAAGVQSDIDAAEPTTHAEYQALKDLERRGDDLAGGGNFFFLGGAILGGVSTYYFVKKGRAAATQNARVAPAVFPHGAGVTLTFGGGR